MKQIFIMAIFVASFADIEAASPATQPARHIPKNKLLTVKPKATAPKSDKDAMTLDDFSSYIGTNDFYLALVREGVKKA